MAEETILATGPTTKRVTMPVRNRSIMPPKRPRTPFGIFLIGFSIQDWI